MSGKETDVGKRGRQDRLIQERVHDPYMKGSKPVEPTVCPECGVVFSGGRWQWQADAPEGAQKEWCPACQRIRDKVPAGFLTLSGEFFYARGDFEVFDADAFVLVGDDSQGIGVTADGITATTYKSAVEDPIFDQIGSIHRKVVAALCQT